MKNKTHITAAIIFYMLLITAIAVFDTVRLDEVNKELYRVKRESSVKDSTISQLKASIDTREYREYLVWRDMELKHFRNLTELPDSIFNLIFQQADSNCIPLPIFLGVIDRESGFKFIPNSEGSGAMGYMQLMPKTFKALSKKIGVHGGHTPMNNIRVGAFYLRTNYLFWLKRLGDDESAWRHALAEYAVGRGGMQFFGRDSTISYHIPEKTVNGINKVMKNYDK